MSSDLESEILAAYLDLADGPARFVRIVDLHTYFEMWDWGAVNQALVRMTRTGQVILSPDSNRRGLTDADHAAAIQIGNEAKHLVAIEDEYGF